MRESAGDTKILELDLKRGRKIWLKSNSVSDIQGGGKSSLRDQCKEIEENNRMERLEISARKLEIPREHSMQRWAQ